MLGGNMSQAGVIAAAGLVALEQGVARLAEDHANARRLGERLAALLGVAVDRAPGRRIRATLGERLAALLGVAVDLATVQTNMVRLSVEPSGLEAPEFVARLRAWGVQAGARDRWTIRMVTHRHITTADVDAAVEIIRDVAAER